jgi:hypothetical protein
MYRLRHTREGGNGENDIILENQQQHRFHRRKTTVVLDCWVTKQALDQKT